MPDNPRPGPKKDQPSTGAPENAGYGGGDDRDYADVATLEQMRERIKEANNAVIDKDDPTAIQFTIHRVFIEHLREVHGEFSAKMEVVLEGARQATADHVRECLQVLKDETLDTSLKQTLARVAQEAANASSVKASLVRLRNATFVMVALSWVALFLNILVLARS